MASEGWKGQNKRQHSIWYVWMRVAFSEPLSPFDYFMHNNDKEERWFHKVLVQFSSLAQSCPTLCDPMNHSTPDLPVHHHLPEFTQTHVHRVSDAIQLSHPLSSPFPPAPNPPPSIRVFSNESTLRVRWPKYWSFSFSIIPSKEIPGLISFRVDWLVNT